MLSEAVIVALVTGTLTLVGTLAGVITSNKATIAMIQTRLEDLTREVRAHNEFARRIPVIENDIETIYHHIDELKK